MNWKDMLRWFLFAAVAVLVLFAIVFLLGRFRSPKPPHQFDILMIAFNAKGDVIQEVFETAPNLSDWHAHFTKEKVPAAAYTQAYVKDNSNHWLCVRYDDGKNWFIAFDTAYALPMDLDTHKGNNIFDRLRNQNETLVLALVMFWAD